MNIRDQLPDINDCVFNDDSILKIFQLMPSYISIFNEYRQVIFNNVRALDFYGMISTEEVEINVHSLSPEYQPDGKKSVLKQMELFNYAMKNGCAQSDWTLLLKNKENVSTKITLVRIFYLGRPCIVLFVQSLVDFKDVLDKIREEDERIRVMLDSTPLCCHYRDKDLNIIDCNQEALNLFGFKSKEEYLKNFYQLLPEKQPNGMLTKDMFREKQSLAIKNGRVKFDWVYVLKDGSILPCEVTFVRVEHKNEFILAVYIRDLREHLSILSEIKESDERVRLMLDANPMGCLLMTQGGKIIECNQKLVSLFEATSKEEIYNNFLDFSPEYQLDGIKSKESSMLHEKQALEQGQCQFEWVHKGKSGEIIPCEILLVRLFYKENKILMGYIRDLRELHRTVELMGQLEKRATLDYLTGVFNRYYFNEKANEIFKETKINKGKLAVIMLDLDKFKVVNDTDGHLAGDDVLKFVVKKAKKVLGENDIFARYGGEEFIALLPDSDPENAINMAEQMRESVETSVYALKGIHIKVTISLGVAILTEYTKILEKLISNVDFALYQAKRKGRNRVEFFTNYNED